MLTLYDSMSTVLKQLSLAIIAQLNRKISPLNRYKVVVCTTDKELEHQMLTKTLKTAAI